MKIFGCGVQVLSIQECMIGGHANGTGLSVIDRREWVTRRIPSYLTVNLSGEHSCCCVVIHPKGDLVLDNPLESEGQFKSKG